MFYCIFCGEELIFRAYTEYTYCICSDGHYKLYQYDKILNICKWIKFHIYEKFIIDCDESGTRIWQNSKAIDTISCLTADEAYKMGGKKLLEKINLILTFE